MLATRFLVLGASLIAGVLAQGRLSFTSTPGVAVQGQSYNLTWSGGDDTAVTVTLRKGDPDNLDTIGILAQRVTDDFFVWTVASDLEPDDDYALQIQQGQDTINYSGLFSIVAGNSTASTTTAATNSTSTTSTFIGSAAGTGTALGRNTTFSSATVSRTSSLAPGSTQHETTTTADRTTSRSTATSSPTAAATTSAPNGNGGGAAQLASSMALMMGVFAAVVFLS